MANFFQNLFNWGNAPRTPILESGAHGRKLEDFEPTRKHINAAIQEAGDTIDARLRWAYNNIPLYGGAADQWASSAIVDGIKPMPIIKGYDSERDALIKRWWRWVDEADYYGRSSFYGLQQLIAREVFLMGECFVILRSIKPTTSYVDLPFRLEVLPKEMLDVHYDAPAKIEGHYIRMGIEFDANDQCVAYHFFTRHPADYTPFTQKNRHQTYVRVDAVDVIHVCENRDAGQLRGLSRATRSLIKFFELNCYDEAELDRKRASALFAFFFTGRGELPVDPNERNKNKARTHLPDTITGGAALDLGDDKDVKFSTPTDVGGNYGEFQYQNLLKICAGLNMPYALVTGDVTRGNFSNARTALGQFRRLIRQWREEIIGYQLNRLVWRRFVEMSVLYSKVHLPHFDEDPYQWFDILNFGPQLEMIDPLKDIMAEKLEIASGLKTLTMALNERGYDAKTVLQDRADELAFLNTLGLKFSDDGSSVIQDEKSDEDDE